MPFVRWKRKVLECVLATCVGTIPVLTPVAVRAEDASTPLPAAATGHLALIVAPDQTCGPVGSQFNVTLDVSKLTDPINGVQTLVRYAPNRIALNSVQTIGNWTEAAMIDDNGKISFAAVLLADATITDDSVATLNFTRLIEGVASVSFQADAPPFVTKLTIDPTNVTIVPTRDDTGPIYAGQPDCLITTTTQTVCPGSSGHVASVPNAGLNATYAWSIVGGTIESGNGTDTITYSVGQDTPVTLTATVTDNVGCPNTCETDVAVSSTQLSAMLEVDAVSFPVTRNVTFVVTDCAGVVETHVTPVAFDGFGQGVAQIENVNLDAQWVSVREGHTLRRLFPLQFDACGFATIDATGNRSLKTGDFQSAEVPQDGIIDIIDFTVLSLAWNTPIDPNDSFGGDANGDGIIGTTDFAALLVNFNSLGEPEDGCPAP